MHKYGCNTFVAVLKYIIFRAHPCSVFPVVVLTLVLATNNRVYNDKNEHAKSTCTCSQGPSARSYYVQLCKIFAFYPHCYWWIILKWQFQCLSQLYIINLLTVDTHGWRNYTRTEHQKAVNNPFNDPTDSVNLDQLREPSLEDLLQPNHSIASEFFFTECIRVCVY